MSRINNFFQTVRRIGSATTLPASRFVVPPGVLIARAIHASHSSTSSHRCGSPLGAATLLTLTGFAYIVASQQVELIIPPHVDPERITSKAELEFVGNAGGYAGHHAPSKYTNGETSAFVKGGLSRKKLAHEYIIGNVIAEAMALTFEREIAPRPDIVVDYDTWQVKLANKTDEWMSNLGITETASRPRGSLCLWSPSLSSDHDNLGEFLNRADSVEALKGITLPGFAVSTLAACLFSSDRNKGNQVIADTENRIGFSYCIDHEVLARDDAILFPFDTTETEAIEYVLDRGLLLETKSRGDSFIEKMGSIAKQQTCKEAFNDSQPEEKFSLNERKIVTALMKHDLQHGQVRNFYQTLAGIRRDDIEKMVEDKRHVLDPKDVKETIDFVMFRIEQVRKHLESHADESLKLQ